MNRFVIWICMVLLVGCATTEMTPEAERNVETVISTPGKGGSEIYSTARMWIVQNLRSSKPVVEHEDPQSKVIVANGTMKFPCKGFDCVAKSDWQLRYSLRIDVKEGRARLQFTNITLFWPSSRGMTGYEGPVNVRQNMNDVRDRLLALSEEMRVAITKSDNAW